MLQRWQAGSGAHGENHTVVWGNDWDDKKMKINHAVALDSCGGIS
jgi:hypothetical protein